LSGLSIPLGLLRREVEQVVQTEETKMTTTLDITPDNDNQLVLARIIDAPVEQVYRGWTDPVLMKKWFAPRPWTTTRVVTDVRPGGSTLVVMADENGIEYPNPGQYLEVVPNKKLVFTDAYTGDWQASEKPFMTVTLTFEDIGGKTRYIARCQHWNAEDKAAHVQMGFHEGWGMVTEQLEQVLKAH
jgi:uncharacterized protein YndB with AHSA1/START domain